MIHPRILMAAARILPMAAVALGWAGTTALAWWTGKKKLEKEEDAKERR